MCLIAVDEEPYLDEFVHHHHALGFDAFLVYDNSAGGADLRQWGRLRGEHVEVIPFPGRRETGSVQLAAYADCANRLVAAEAFEWAAFFDADEFLVLKRHRHVADMLAEHCPRGSLGVNWFSFGSDGWNVASFEPVSRRFLYREAGVNRHVKTIVRLADAACMKNPDNPHNFVELKDRLVMRDSDGKDVIGPFNEDGPVDVAVLHHYHVKSSKEYFRKRTRGRADQDPSDPIFVKMIADNIRAANRSYASALSSDRLPRDDSISKNASLTFDDSAWQFLKENVPGYALFDKIALVPATAAPVRSRIDTHAPAVSSTKRKQTAMCLTVANEELYLDEFVDYHRALGFDHFFVYDRSEGFEMKQWGKLRRDHVEVIPFSGRKERVAPQAAHVECAHKLVATGMFEWVAFFDADEFLVLKKHDRVADMLEEHCPRGSLGVHRYSFGSDHWNVYTSEPTTRRFLYRDADVDPRVKTIVRLDDVMRIRHPNDTSPELEDQIVMRDFYGKNITASFNEKGPVDVVVLHHYGFKSAKEYFQKQTRRSADKDPSNPANAKKIQEKTQFLNRSLSSSLSREHRPRDKTISENPNLIFDDSAWQFLKKHVPGYLLFDEIALMPATNNSALVIDSYR